MSDYESLFASAISSLAKIDQALGIGDDCCGEPDQTIFAIHEMQQRISELESALKMCHHYAFDDSHGLDDDDALDRIRAISYKALETPR